MPGRNKTPLLGWHPPAELAAWARTEAQRRGVPLARILDAALREYRERAERTQVAFATADVAELRAAIRTVLDCGLCMAAGPHDDHLAALVKAEAQAGGDAAQGQISPVADAGDAEKAGLDAVAGSMVPFSSWTMADLKAALRAYGVSAKDIGPPRPGGET